jgi:nucleotide-binding universal stress UspA family protein
VTAQPIVVGVDGSSGASRALDWALSWAEAVGSPVRVLAAEAVPPGRTADSPGLGGTAGSVIEAEQARLREAGRDGAEVETEAVVAHPVSALIAESQEAGAVVVGTRGRGAYQGNVIGSIAGAVAASAHCPTVVIPPGAPERHDSEGPIVVGFDGSEASLGAARLAVSAAAAEGRAVVLIQAEIGATSPDEPLDHIAEELRTEHPDVTIELRATAEDAAEALTSASQDAAFVVVSSHGHRGVPGFLLGSTARALVQTAQSPVIVLTGRSEKRWPVRAD